MHFFKHAYGCCDQKQDEIYMLYCWKWKLNNPGRKTWKWIIEDGFLKDICNTSKQQMCFRYFPTRESVWKFKCNMTGVWEKWWNNLMTDQDTSATENSSKYVINESLPQHDFMAFEIRLQSNIYTDNQRARAGITLHFRCLCSAVRGFPELYILYSGCSPASKCLQMMWPHEKSRQQQTRKQKIIILKKLSKNDRNVSLVMQFY